MDGSGLSPGGTQAVEPPEKRHVLRARRDVDSCCGQLESPPSLLGDHTGKVINHVLAVVGIGEHSKRGNARGSSQGAKVPVEVTASLIDITMDEFTQRLPVVPGASKELDVARKQRFGLVSDVGDEAHLDVRGECVDEPETGGSGEGGFRGDEDELAPGQLRLLKQPGESSPPFVRR